jgi:translation initiation factor 4E
VQVKLGRQLKSFLDLGESVKVGYMAHDDAIKMDRKATERYTL